MADDEFELMEVDEELSSSNTSTGIKRSFNRNVSTFQATKVNDLTKMPIKRNYLKAKRSLRMKISKGQNTSIICVLDTNVLIDQITILKRIVTKINSHCHKIKNFIIPWIVLQELDGLKNKKTINKSVTNIINFLNEQFKLKNGLIKGETAMVRKKTIKKSIDVINNDDNVLNCCLNLLTSNCDNNDEDGSGGGGGGGDGDDGGIKVILLTNDINLQNKALVHKIVTMNMEDFIRIHLEMFDLKAEVTKDNDGDDINEEDEEEDSAKNDITNPHKYRRLESGPISIIKSTNADKKTLRRCTLPSNSLISRTNLSSDSSTSTSVSLDSSKKPDLSSNNNNNNNDSNDNFLSLKYELETALISFIVEQLSQCYGAEEWREVVPYFNPNNASLVECLRLIKRLWIGIFSDSFNRDKSVLTLIDHLLIQLKTTSRDITATTKSLQKLFNLLKILQ